MLLLDFLRLAVQVTFVAIGGLTLLNYLRRRNQARLDIALMFGALAYNILVQWLTSATGIDAPLLGLISQMVLMAHPFLLLRLVLHFRPVPRYVLWGALAGLAISWVSLIIFFGSDLPVPVVLLLVAYFVLVEAYATLSFLLGARHTRSVTRYRLLLAASGSLALAGVILLAGINALLTVGQEVVSMLSQVVALLGALSYFVAFSPPNWLRRNWQLSELYPFLRRTLAPDSSEESVSILEFLCTTAVSATGGLVAVAALWDQEQEQLVVRASSHPHTISPGTVLNLTAIQKAWTEQQPLLSDLSRKNGHAPGPALIPAKAGAIMAAPIGTAEFARGMLVVYQWRMPLFAPDDLALLGLMAEQTSIVLGYVTLLAEQQGLIQRLQQRTQQLQIANRELESFSYSVSHDLRAPLRHISGYVELLQKRTAGTLDEQSERYLQTVLQSAGRMGRLIDDLLAASRLGRTEIHKSGVDLHQTVQQIIAEYRPETSTREIVWKLGRLPIVEGDPTMLSLVLENLISNALKFTRPHSPAVIEIGAIPDEQEDVIFVRDNGIGFDMNHAHQLFGFFQRLHGKEYEGTGIGLANVRRVIQRHGGRTWAEGQVGAGATFYFSLPRKRTVSTEGTGHAVNIGRKDEYDPTETYPTGGRRREGRGIDADRVRGTGSGQ